MCLFEVCQEISPADTKLIGKCCKLLIKVLPKLSSGEENLLKKTIIWILSCIVVLEKHERYFEQINEILHFYVSAIQLYENLNINDKKVNYYFNIRNICLT